MNTAFRLVEPTPAYTAANDNAPHYADDFPNLNARRAWLDALPAKAAPVLAWPTAERLSRIDPPTSAGVLIRYARLCDPARAIAANDNAEPGVELDPEMRHETRPGVMELLRAADDDLVINFACRADADGGWSMRLVDGVMVCFAGDRVSVGSLAFDRGALRSYGRGRRPKEQTRAPRGATNKPRSAESIRFLLSTEAPVAKGAGFFGGITRPRGNGSRPDIGDAEAEVEFQRNSFRNAFHLALGHRDALVLDLAISDSSAREIGETLGFSGKRAERKAIRAIDDALAKFQKIAA